MFFISIALLVTCQSRKAQTFRQNGEKHTMFKKQIFCFKMKESKNWILGKKKWFSWEEPSSEHEFSEPEPIIVGYE